MVGVTFLFTSTPSHTTRFHPLTFIKLIVYEENQLYCQLLQLFPSLPCARLKDFQLHNQRQPLQQKLNKNAPKGALLVAWML